MAKRKKVTAPTADDLERLDEEFRRETINRPPVASAPISQVAADAAVHLAVTGSDARAEQARDKADAQRLRSALAEGLVIRQIPLADIDDAAMVRDRTVMDPAELDELKTSIALHGLRLPIELFEQDGTRPFGLLSGYRRLYAMRALAQSGEDRFQTIKALVRDPKTLGGAFTAMVEENEVRANLSQYERGRICVIAAGQGAFGSLEDAVNGLFTSASKAKRSKIRSFSLIFEELGDMLEFPENLREKQGLRIANALRAGGESRFREVLASDNGVTPETEWALMEQVCFEFESETQPKPRGGRPKVQAPAPGWQNNDVLRLSNGITIQKQEDSHGHLIRFKGKAVSSEVLRLAMEDLQRLMEAR